MKIQKYGRKTSEVTHSPLYNDKRFLKNVLKAKKTLLKLVKNFLSSVF